MANFSSEYSMSFLKHVFLCADVTKAHIPTVTIAARHQVLRGTQDRWDSCEQFNVNKGRTHYSNDLDSLYTWWVHVVMCDG